MHPAEVGSLLRSGGGGHPLRLRVLPLTSAGPLVCRDELCTQLVSEVAGPANPAPGRPGRYDADYVREGSASGFMICALHLGRREVFAGDSGRRAALDYADAVRFLCEEMFPGAEKIILVEGNLNTHNPASLYKRFPPQKARELARRIEWHYTPKRGSWRNIAEIEISVLSRAALRRRIPDLETFKTQIAVDTARRNSSPQPVSWPFTAADAKIKLKRL